MQIIKFILLFSLVSTLLSCSTDTTVIHCQSIYLFKDKDGLYLYDPQTDKEKIIFKATDNQVFLDEPIKIVGDTITFGIKGDLVFAKTSETESGGERYFNDYYSVNLKTGKSWLSEKVIYEVIGHSKLNIKILQYNNGQNATITLDSTMKYQGSSSSYKGTKYNQFNPRFYTVHSLGESSVFSNRGSIYYVSKQDTVLLAQNNTMFNPKTGGGFFDPQIAPSGEFVVFSFHPGLWDTNNEPSLQKINIKTKRIEIMKKGDYYNPTFSADGKFMLYSRDEKEGKSTTWISDIYLLDLTTLKEKKISQAYSAKWRPGATNFH
jgi:hypothetical protein